MTRAERMAEAARLLALPPGPDELSDEPTGPAEIAGAARAVRGELARPFRLSLGPTGYGGAPEVDPDVAALLTDAERAEIARRTGLVREATCVGLASAEARAEARRNWLMSPAGAAHIAEMERRAEQSRPRYAAALRRALEFLRREMGETP